MMEIYITKQTINSDLISNIQDIVIKKYKLIENIIIVAV